MHNVVRYFWEVQSWREMKPHSDIVELAILVLVHIIGSYTNLVVAVSPKRASNNFHNVHRLDNKACTTNNVANGTKCIA